MIFLFYLLILALWALTAESAYRIGGYRNQTLILSEPFKKYVKRGHWLIVGVFFCLYLLLLLQVIPYLLPVFGIEEETWVQGFAMAKAYSPWLLLCGVPLLGFRSFFQGALEKWEDELALARYREGIWKVDPTPYLRNVRMRTYRFPRYIYRGYGYRWGWYGGYTAGRSSVGRGGVRPFFGGGQTAGGGAGRSFGAGTGGSARVSGSGSHSGSGSKGTGGSSGGASFGGGQTAGGGARRSFATTSSQAAVTTAAVTSARPARASSGKGSGKSSKGKDIGKGAAPLLVVLLWLLIWLILAALVGFLSWGTARVFSKWGASAYDPEQAIYQRTGQGRLAQPEAQG